MDNAFVSKLLTWYETNKRELPWRNERDPYKVWISEIILQQTRVAQGWSYYLRFIERFPDLQSVYEGGEQEVLKYWQGLGYYTRARNIYAGAVYIVEEYNGVFPSTYQEILKIKGVGTYTAAAIASFAFRRPHAVIDGNVLRIFARIHGIYDPIDNSLGKNKISELANSLIPNDIPHLFNQALMDFGAIHCSPQLPKCSDCCFSLSCYANLHYEQSALPVKGHKTKTRNRFFYYLCIENKDYIYLQKRNSRDIWQGLYEFPLWETSAPLSDIYSDLTPYLQNLLDDIPFEIIHASHVYKHVLSHQIITAVFIRLKIPHAVKQTNFLYVHRHNLADYPVSRLMEKFLNEYLELHST